MVWQHGNQILGPQDVTKHGLGNWQLLKFRWQSVVQVHIGGGRSSPRSFWCFWYDELLEPPGQHLWQTVPHHPRHSFCACNTLKGFFFCVRPGRRNNNRVIAQYIHVSLFETEQRSIGKHRLQSLCVNFGTLTLMEMNCK